MKAKIYFNNDAIIGGITLKDDTAHECNNMALHSCKNPKDIIHNRKKLADFLNIMVDDFVCASQTHSATFYQVTLEDKGRGALDKETAIKNTDALYTYEPNLLLCSFSADCVPVIFYHNEKKLIGVIHSGWRGTVNEITLKLFNHLIEKENCHPHGFHLQIGMALSQEKFEVREDVYELFKKLNYADEFIEYNPETDKYHIDNQQTVKKQCEIVGIPTSHITVDPTCTFISPNGFSYREDKQAGRHLSFIMMKD